MVARVTTSQNWKKKKKTLHGRVGEGDAVETKAFHNLLKYLLTFVLKGRV
jgi:hypothetical protein